MRSSSPPSFSTRSCHQTELADRIIERGLSGLAVADQMRAYCNDLCEAGLPIRRANLSINTLHPRYGAHSFIWHAGGEFVEHLPRMRNIWREAIFRQSPVYYLRRTGERTLRRRLDGIGPLQFPILDDLCSEGMSDYFGCLVDYRLFPDMRPSAAEAQLDGLYFSGATNSAHGFDDAQVADVAASLRPFSLAVKSRAVFDVGRKLLETYLGRDAGRRVLTGSIDKGSVETIRAVIWLCDLRGFTALADVIALDRLVRILDDYLDVMAAPVLAHGGEILKFLGDGFIATFPLEGRLVREACADVIAAARDLRSRMDAFNRGRNAVGEPSLASRLAIHIGEVLYGNIGALDRLDFTMVGPAINEASRMEALCKSLEVDVLFSQEFQAVCTDKDQLESVGSFCLRGVQGTKEMFTLAA